MKKDDLTKLEYVMDELKKVSNRYSVWSSMPVIYKQDIDPLIDLLGVALAELNTPDLVVLEKNDKEVTDESIMKFVNALDGMDEYEQINLMRGWVIKYGSQLSNEIKDINFIKWYSGMDEVKIRNAHKRYVKENSFSL